MNTVDSKEKLANRKCDHRNKKANMKNDLTDTATSMGPEIFGEMARISEYTFERADARHWASRRIRFLVYDDSDAKLDDFDSDDEEAKEEYAINLSLGNVKAGNPEEGGGIPNTEEVGVAGCSQYPSDSGQTKCRVCASYPEFPHKWKPRKFRLVNPVLDHPEWFNTGKARTSDFCIHYVAVSYCWPPCGEDPTPRSYTVRDLNGHVRSSRALDDVLDRAVDFANSYGLRMIWID